MRFLVDECVDAGLIARLREAGHDVRSVQETDPGIDDARVFTIAARENRILLTEDKDFTEFAFRRSQTQPLPSVLLLRLPPGFRDRKWARLDAAINTFGERLYRSHAVVHVTKIRLRPTRRD